MSAEENIDKKSGVAAGKVAQHSAAAVAVKLALVAVAGVIVGVFMGSILV